MVTLSRCLWDRAEQRRAQQEKQRQRKGGQEVLQRRGMRIRAGAGKRRAADDVAATTAAPPERKPSRRRVSRKKLDCFSELMLRLLGLNAWIYPLIAVSACCCIPMRTKKGCMQSMYQLSSSSALLCKPCSCFTHVKSAVPLCAYFLCTFCVLHFWK